MAPEPDTFEIGLPSVSTAVSVDDDMDAPLLQVVRGSNQQTAKLAVKLLKGAGYIEPTKHQRRNLAVAFAEVGKVVYGKAFDVVSAPSDLDIGDLDQLRARLSSITLYEVKSTKSKYPERFPGYFFALTTAELLVAQSLNSAFKFLFVSVYGNSIYRQEELTLEQVYNRARKIYPTWSITLGP